MAGKSGRTISNTVSQPWKKVVLSWEGVLVLLFIAINILCICISPVYNAQNLLRESPKYLAEMLLLFPMAYLLILGEIDISVGSIVCLSATMACMASNAGVPFLGVFFIAVLTGLVCGAFNGLITVKFRELPTMIITLGTQIVFRGIAEIALGSGGSISLTDSSGFKMLNGKVGIFPYSFFLIIICAVVFTVIADRMNYGRKLYAIGSNAKTSFYSGIKVKQTIFIAFVVIGIFAGLSGLFLTSTAYGANTTTGKNFEMDAIAMAVFGGVSNMGGKGKLYGAFVSAFTIMCLRIGLGQINVNSQVILIILGLLLICAVLLPNIAGTISQKKKTVK